MATAEEQGELEAALEDEAGDGGAGPSGGPPPGGEAGTSDPQAGQARWEEEQARKAAEVEDVDVVLSQQLKELPFSPSKSPPPKKPKKGGDGASSSQAVELTETEE